METLQAHTMLLEFERWLIYLRKSRQDDPTQTVEEVLAKHETVLQEYAEKEFGGRIPDGNIYREVVSGESIDDRVEVKKVLARIEDPDVRGVMVVEPSRLSRGDLADCDRIIKAFRFSSSLICTPMMTYDLEKKMERKFFQDELLRGNDYLEYTKEILYRGRVAAVKRGCYLGNTAPYGYRKVKIGRDHTLEIIEEEAEIVRLVFDLYTKKQLTPGAIAKQLNEMGLPAPKGGVWQKDTIRWMVRNVHYIGKVSWNKHKYTQVLENGEITTKRLAQPEEEVIISEGKQPAILDMETWNTAQELVARNPRRKHTWPLKNPYSTMLVCGNCGKALFIHPYKQAEDRYECRSAQRTGRCYKSVKFSELNEAIIKALETSELPALQFKLKNDDGNAAKIQKHLIEKLEKQMEEYRDQEDKQFDLLETGKYTQDLFDRRNAVLRAKMEECQKQIYQARAAMPENVDYAERVDTLTAAIAKLRDPDATPEQKNRLLKSVVDKIEFFGVPPVDKSKGWKKGENAYKLKITLRL